MKKLFLFIIVVLLLVTFSGKEPLKTYRDALYNKALTLIPEHLDDEHKAMKGVNRELTELGLALGQRQQQLLANAATDKTQLLLFRQRYCIDKDFNPVLYGKALHDSCSIIEKYAYLLIRN